MKEVLDEPLYFEEYQDVASELSKGNFAKCIVRGTSMLPFFSLGEDYLVLAPLKKGDDITDHQEMIIDRHNKVPKRKKRNTSAAEDRMTIRRRDIVKATYENAVAKGDKNVYFIDGSDIFKIFGGDSCTVDDCHPNDLGFMCMAEILIPYLRKVLYKTED